MQIWGRHNGAAGRASLAGATAAIVALLLPVELLELVTSSVGLSEVVPALAPPLGWTARIGFAVLAGMAGAGVAWSISPVQTSSRRQSMSFAWPRSLSWSGIARIARGTESDAPVRHDGDHPPMDFDWSQRRRVDQHPDAPPRQPLIASRDLPPLDLGGMETANVFGPDAASPPSQPVADPTPAAAAPIADDPVPPSRGLSLPFLTEWPSPRIRDTTGEERPRPLPRAPEPLSDADIDSVRAMLSSLPVKPMAPAAPVAPIATPRPVEPFSLAGDLPDYADDAPLSSLMERFERQFERKIAIRDAQTATQRVEAHLPPEQAQSTSQVQEPDEGSPASETDEALYAALEALKKLATQSRKR